MICANVPIGSAVIEAKLVFQSNHNQNVRENLNKKETSHDTQNGTETHFDTGSP